MFDRTRKEGEPHGMWEKSRSYANSIAREMTSPCGRANAGCSCRSYTFVQTTKQDMCRRGKEKNSVRSYLFHLGGEMNVNVLTSTTAPRYLSAKNEGAADSECVDVEAISDDLL